MPTYDYLCSKGHRFELFHSIRDESLKRCPKCRARAKRVPGGGAGLLFKGTGFYITDYRSRSYRDKAKAEGAGSKSEGAGTKSEGSGGSTGGDTAKSASPTKERKPGETKASKPRPASDS